MKVYSPVLHSAGLSAVVEVNELSSLTLFLVFPFSMGLCDLPPSLPAGSAVVAA